MHFSFEPAGSFILPKTEGREGMATSRIKGITIEIGGDTTKLQTALKGVNTGESIFDAFP